MKIKGNGSFLQIITKYVAMEVSVTKYDQL